MSNMMHPCKGSLEPGATISKYRVERMIGVGGMGTVYEATHLEIGRKVAIKRLHSEFLGDESVMKRFFREAQTAGSVGDDNICHIEDMGIADDGVPFLIMPLLKGASLADILKQDGHLPLERAVDIAIQILSALSATHNHDRLSIIHRDLKPDNVFLTTVGKQRDFVKILDFGIAKVRELETTHARPKQEITTHFPIGTGPYMAPEQASVRPDIDHRVDIYAVGVILYEMLTGKRPYQGERLSDYVEKVQVAPFPPPRSIMPQIPKRVEHVIIKAMSRDRDDRFSSADEMQSELESALREGPDGCSTDPATMVTAGGAQPVSGPSIRQSMRPAGRKRIVRRAGRLMILVVVAGIALVAVALFAALPETEPPTAGWLPTPRLIPTSVRSDPPPAVPDPVSKEPIAATTIQGSHAANTDSVTDSKRLDIAETVRKSPKPKDSKQRIGRRSRSRKSNISGKSLKSEGDDAQKPQYRERGRGGSLFLAPNE
jgi:eukaryotic-like serine/threonine-protein kinase